VSKYVVVIIGAGIVGASIARVLSMYENLSVYVIEREADVGWGVSKANTAILHPGHEEDPSKHPLRARLCVEGNRLWRSWVKELDIPSKFPGELMLFFSEDEGRRARDYLRLAKLNGVPEVRIIDSPEEVKLLEPNVSKDVLGCVWAATAGQINPIQAVIALIENSVDNGVKLLTETAVRDIKVEDGVIKGVVTNRGFLRANIVINAAGLHADEVSRLVGINEFTIRPRRGVYYVFDPNAEPKVRRILHPVPTPISKGVYVVTTTEGNLMIGPSAKDLPMDHKERTETTYEELNYVWREASRLVSKLPPKSLIIRTFAGLRPEPSTGDFIIKAYSNPWGFINVAGMRSPGLTAAPAIAYYVRDLLRDELGLRLRRKSTWIRFRVGIKRVRDMSWSEVRDAVTKNTLYGWIVCRDEVVSAAEVIEAVRRILRIGARVTLDGIKFRTWSMMGRCQGNFCRLRIIKLVSDYLGIEPTEVSKSGLGSEYVIGDIKKLWRERGGGTY